MNGITAVWLRNFLYLRKYLILNFFWAAFEPILYLFAIGFALGQSIGSFEGVRYIDFYVPALLTTTAMTVGYFEGTYGTFTKLVYQKTFSTIFLAPVSAQEIIIGEILWFSSKCIMGFVCVALVAFGFGAMSSHNLPFVFFALFLTAVMFVTMGVLVASFAKNYDSFTYTISGFIVPMSLFSGTYFPLKDLPEWIQRIAYVLPLTHAVQLVRELMLDRENPMMIYNILYMITLTTITTTWSIRRITNRLEN